MLTVEEQNKQLLINNIPKTSSSINSNFNDLILRYMKKQQVI